MENKMWPEENKFQSTYFSFNVRIYKENYIFSYLIYLLVFLQKESTLTDITVGQKHPNSL